METKPPDTHEFSGLGGHRAVHSFLPADECNDMESQDPYLFWLTRRVWSYSHIYTPQCSSQICPSPQPLSNKETAILLNAKFKFMLCSLELRLHFTAHLSLWLELCLFSLWRRQSRSVKVLFLESSSLAVWGHLWWNNPRELRVTTMLTEVMQQWLIL